MNWDWLFALTRKDTRTAVRVESGPPVKPRDDVGGKHAEKESARRLARLGGSEPQLKPVPRRRSI
jgi:hypothetical protein